jgi:hypothetical protein
LIDWITNLIHVPPHDDGALARRNVGADQGKDREAPGVNVTQVTHDLKIFSEMSSKQLFGFFDVYRIDEVNIKSTTDPLLVSLLLVAKLTKFKLYSSLKQYLFQSM